MARTAPYGTWASPLGAADLVEGALGLGYPTAAGDRVFWQEARPSEAGRVALVARDRGSDQDSELLPADMSARTTVHEYGGRAWAIAGPASQLIVTSNFIDQRLWVVQSGAEPRALTAAPQQPKSVRFEHFHCSRPEHHIGEEHAAHPDQGSEQMDQFEQGHDICPSGLVSW